MQISVEKLNGLERKITVELPTAQIDSEVSKRLDNLTKTVKIDGFRKGKVPVSEVQRRYGKAVRQEVLGDMMQRSFFEAVNEKELRPAGMPQIAPKTSDTADKFEFEATFEVYPDVQLPDFTQLAIEKISTNISDKEIDETLEAIRKQQIEWQPVDRASQNGDQVIIDFAGTLEGKPLEKGDAKAFPLELGSHSMISGFEEGIVGAKAGDELTIKPTFPEDYHAKELAGKTVEFAIKVQKVNAPKLPELNDEFAKRLKIPEGTVDALRNEIRINMERELKHTLQNQNKQRVMDALVESTTLELPKALIDSEIQQMQQQFLSQFGAQGDFRALAEKSNDLFEGQARRRVTLGLLVGEFIKQNSIKADPAKIKEHITSLASAYEQPADVLKWYYSDKNRLAEVEALILENQVVDTILEKAKVTEKTVPFAEIMNRNQQQHHVHDENCNHDHH